MNRVYCITFSPTGSSKKVAQLISKVFDHEVIEIDLCKEIMEEIQIENDSVCIVSMPCYGGRIPKIAADRLSKVHGLNSKAIICVTYGNRAYEDALLELSDVVIGTGLQVIAGAAIATEHNIMHVYGTGRPDKSDVSEIETFAKQVIQKIQKKDVSSPIIPGNRPYKEAHGGGAPIQVDSDTCAKCGICALECPVNAISSDGQTTNPDKCISCMRCISICPNQSRALPSEYVDRLMQRLHHACKDRKNNEFYL